MEDFIIDDNFYSDLDAFCDSYGMSDKDIRELPDDWSQEIELTTREPMFVLCANSLADMIEEYNLDRFPEETEATYNRVKDALETSIDFENLNTLIPRLMYGNGVKVVITKQDLIDNFK